MTANQITHKISCKNEYSMYGLALDILHDRCPPDNTMYLCSMMEDLGDGTECERCWEKFLLHAINMVNGYGKCDPYECDRNRWGREN